MEIEYTEGCTCFSLTVDKEDFKDLNSLKKKDLWGNIVNYISTLDLNDDELQDYIIKVIQDFGIIQHQYHCETCGDDVYTFTLNI